MLNILFKQEIIKLQANLKCDISFDNPLKKSLPWKFQRCIYYNRRENSKNPINTVFSVDN